MTNEMPKPKNELRMVTTVELDAELMKEMKKYLKREGITMRAAMEWGLREFMIQREAIKKGGK